MQKVKPFLLLSVLLAGVVLFSACGNSGKSIQYISKDAMAVLHVDGGKIGRKVTWEAILNPSVFKNMKPGDGKDIGIDMINDFYVYALPDQRMPDRAKLFAIIPLNDASKWQHFIREKYPDAVTRSENGIEITIARDNIVIGKKNKMVIACFTGTSGLADESTAILEDEVVRAFNMEKDNSLSGNDQFKALLAKNYDVGIWVNYKKMMEASADFGLASALASQEKLSKDGYLIGGFDFEKGVVKGAAVYFTNSTMAAVMQKIAPQALNNDALKYIPSDSITALVNLHINPAGIKTLLDTLGQTAQANLFLREEGLTVDGVLGAFSGDFSFVMGKPVMTQSSYETLSMDGKDSTVTYTSPKMLHLLAIKIKDPAALDKLIQLALGQEMLTVKGNNVFAVGSDYATLRVQDGYIFANVENGSPFNPVSNSPVSARVPAETLDHPLGIFVDFQMLKPLFLSNDDSKESKAFAGLFDHLLVYGGKASGDHIDYHFSLKMQDKEENSLMSIIKAVAEAGDPKQPEGVAVR